MTFVPDRLTAVNHKSPALKINSIKLIVGDLIGHHVIGKVWEPGNRPVFTRDRFQQQGRHDDPFERIYLDTWYAKGERKMKSRNQSHVMIERQPADNFVVLIQFNCLAVTFDVVENRAVRQQDWFLQTSRPR